MVRSSLTIPTTSMPCSLVRISLGASKTLLRWRPLSRIKINLFLSKGDVIQGTYVQMRYGREGVKVAFTLATCQVVRLVNKDFKFRMRFEYTGMRPFRLEGLSLHTASFFEILPTLNVEFEPAR